MPSASATFPDVVLIGGGVMSATFAALLKDLSPELSITMFETLEHCGQESSKAWNNAGTGHAGNCELNYTPQHPNGSVDISKALAINTEFDISRQLWSHWVRNGRLEDAGSFIHACPHVSLVWGKKDVAFLKARYDAMASHHCFDGMEYSEDPAVIADWAPLAMEGRDPSVPVAATRIRSGTDVDFGALTRNLFSSLEKETGFHSFYRHRVTDLVKTTDGRWRVTAVNMQTGAKRSVLTRFVFVGAGGAALSLLQKSGIPEARRYAGFPVSGLWLQCTDPAITQRHHAKVYGKAPVGSPPMSVPHLDTRVIDGKSCLLFGPYAGFSTKFLKSGSWMDYFRSLNGGNLIPAVTAAKDNLSLMNYLVREVTQSDHKRFRSLLNFYPRANENQWTKVVAGQRVQIIKPNNGGLHGVLRFGTELVRSSDQSLAAVLGASPGASIAASVALQVVEKCFPQNVTASAWLPCLREIFPGYGVDLKTNPELCRELRRETARTLQIEN